MKSLTATLAAEPNRVKVAAYSVLQVSPQDTFGGAERVAWNLAEGARQRGVESWLAVGKKTNNASHVLQIPKAEQCSGPWGRFWLGAHRVLMERKLRGTYKAARVSRWFVDPLRSIQEFFGIEDFHHPGTRRLLDLVPKRPSLVHCHNLHGNYFDLRFLPTISKQVPVVLTLHDSWLLSGHCSHSFECERWKTGCGRCPDLTLYPAIRRDATAFNWRRKQRIFSRSRLHIATPCMWLMDKVRESMLMSGAVSTRVIPNGVDLGVFQPGDPLSARQRLGLPADARVLLFIANRWIRGSRAKDFPTMREAIRLVGHRLRDRSLIFVALGEDGPREKIGNAEIRFFPYQNDPSVVALHYQAADLYMHAAHADTFPTTVLEALACGVPVVATAICGIPEQVKGWSGAGVTVADYNRHEEHTATGVLVSHADAEQMARAAIQLLENDSVRAMLSANARADASARFDLKDQIDAYLDWYEELLDRRREKGGIPTETAGVAHGGG